MACSGLCPAVRGLRAAQNGDTAGKHAESNVRLRRSCCAAERGLTVAVLTVAVSCCVCAHQRKRTSLGRPLLATLASPNPCGMRGYLRRVFQARVAAALLAVAEGAVPACASLCQPVVCIADASRALAGRRLCVWRCQRCGRLFLGSASTASRSGGASTSHPRARGRCCPTGARRTSARAARVRGGRRRGLQLHSCAGCATTSVPIVRHCR
jgi:hypothetical protein